MSKTADMEFLKSQLVVLERERKRLQDALAKLPELEAEIQAISFVLSKYSGEKSQIHVAVQEARARNLNAANGESLSKLIARALIEAGKPQTSAQLLSFIMSHGRTVKNSTLRSIIHQSKQFKSVTPGVYGLVEWQQ